MKALPRFAAALVLIAASIGCAHAQLFRAYVSSTGSDTNACTLPAPCRLLPMALSKVAAGGEVWMLDSANYNVGTVAIQQSVSILAVPGAVGSILTIGGQPAISVAVGGVSLALRNVVITSSALNPGTDGISVTAGGDGPSISVEDCLFANIPQDGIRVSTFITLYVKNTVFRNMGNWAVDASNGAIAMIANTHILGGGAGGGVQAAVSVPGSTTVVDITDSIISGGFDGVLAQTSVDNGNAHITVTRSTIANTVVGLDAQAPNNVGNALVLVTNSSVTHNENGFALSGTGAVVQSLGNNNIGDNSSGDVGVLSSAALR
jgi:hypothetical protein